MAISCITANLQRRAAALDAVLDRRPDVLFAQEAPPTRDGLAEAYEVFEYLETDPYPAYACRSFVAVRRDAGLEPAPIAIPTAQYHRSYLAAAAIQVDDLGQVILLSVHASPREIGLDSRYLDDWQPTSLPTPRAACSGTLWDADFVLATLAGVAGRGATPVIGAGDFNEARGPNTLDPAWAVQGAEFFDAAGSFGLLDVTLSLWHGERATHGDAQLDHVLATHDLAARIAQASVAHNVGSDHLPIGFTIDA